jgi:hypothetical protein
MQIRFSIQIACRDITSYPSCIRLGRLVCQRLACKDSIRVKMGGGAGTPGQAQPRAALSGGPSEGRNAPPAFKPIGETAGMTYFLQNLVNALQWGSFYA